MIATAGRHLIIDLGKLVSLLCSILALYWTAVSAFFDPGTRWQARLVAALLRLTIAGCICLGSGMLFTWPAKTNPDAGLRLIATLPVRLFLWGTAALVVLFALSWLLTCGTPCTIGVNRNCLCT